MRARPIQAQLILCGVVAAAGMAVSPQEVQAGPFVIGPTITPKAATENPADVDVHPGKEYSDERDKDSSGPLLPSLALDPLQSIQFDGSPPGGVTDGIDYPNILNVGQIDAMANSRDTLFAEATDNATAIAYSLRNTAPEGSGADIGAPIYYETTSGATGVWATVPQVDQHGVRNLDSLEIWGEDLSPNATHHSRYRDALTPSSISIYNPSGLAYLDHADLATAVTTFFSLPTTIFIERQIDIDAMMIFDVVGTDEEFVDGDLLMFSLWPIFDSSGSLVVVGDEVMVWTKGSSSGLGSGLSYLGHGGHVWDTGWLGHNVDALEALGVPEPSSLSLLALGLAGLAVSRRRRRAPTQQ